MKELNLKLSPIYLGLIMVLQPNNVLAQEQQDKRAIEVIEITSTKRITTLQETPHSISAISGNELENTGADDLVDFVDAVPGLTLRDQGPGQTRPVIRGLHGVGEALVGTYIDEIPITGSPGVSNDSGRFQPELKLFDINRIEVLRGPQGTLYGSGSMGGTLRVITNKPKLNDFEAKFATELTTTEEGDPSYQVNGVVNIPLIEDEVALRVVLYDREVGGYIDNVLLDQKDINNIETTGGRAALRWQPNEELNVILTGYYQDQDVGGGFHINPSLEGDYETAIGAEEPFLDEIRAYNLTIDYSFSFADVVYSASRFERDAEFNFFANIVVPNGTLANQPQTSKATTHELRFSSNNDSAFQWAAGLYSQDREGYVESNVLFLKGNTGVSNGNYFLQRIVDSTQKEKAIFGEISYQISEKLIATIGARYFDIENSSSAVPLRGINGNPDIQGTLVENPVTNVTKGQEEDNIFKFHLAYIVNDDALIYGQFSQGFRAGGANQNLIGLTEFPNSYESDTVDNLELGFRSTWLDDSLKINSSFYHMEWDNMQVQLADTSGLFGYSSNGGEAIINGMELELVAQLTDNLKLISNLSLLDASLDSDAPFSFNGDAATTSQTGITGDDIPNVPSETAKASLEYWTDFGDIEATFSFSASYTGESFSDFNPYLVDRITEQQGIIDNVAYNSQGNYTVFDARALFEKDGWKVAIFIDNLANKRVITNVLEDNFRADPGYNFTERPRTIGISFSKEIY